MHKVLMIRVHEDLIICYDIPDPHTRNSRTARINPSEDPWCKIADWILSFSFSRYIFLSNRPCESVLKALGFQNYALCYDYSIYFIKLSIRALLNFTVVVQFKGNCKKMVPELYAGKIPCFRHFVWAIRYGQYGMGNTVWLQSSQEFQFFWHVI